MSDTVAHEASFHQQVCVMSAAYALGFLDCNDISARCMLTIFQFFATKTDASKLRMLNGSPKERLLKPITDYVEARGGRLHIRWGCRHALTLPGVYCSFLPHRSTSETWYCFGSHADDRCRWIESTVCMRTIPWHNPFCRFFTEIHLLRGWIVTEVAPD